MAKLPRSISSNIDNVKISGGFWYDRLKLVTEKVIFYQWSVLDDPESSHTVENFRIAAHRSKGRFSGMPFQDSDLAKWIEAASYSLLVRPDANIEQITDDVIDLMASAQQGDGYLNTYFTLAKPDQRWKNFSLGHELYCAGHLIEAAVAYYQATGKRKLLDVASRFADYIDSVIGAEPEKMRVYSGHPEIELALIKLYRTTNNQRYLRLAEYFINERGKHPNFMSEEPYFIQMSKDRCFALDYYQAHAPVREQHTAEGHAVRAMYLYAGMADVAAETGDRTLLETLHSLWDNVVQRRMYVTGALGSQAHGERFTIDFDLPNDRAYAETCASIGLIFWAHRMLLLENDRRYTDVLERALYNGAISGMSLDGRKYFYVNPLEIDPLAVANRYDLKHVQTQRQAWFACACCPPNLARLICSLGQYIYSKNDNEVYIHLFVDSSVSLTIGRRELTLTQNTNYPWDGNIGIELKLAEPMEVTLSLRVPSWCDRLLLEINGEPIAVDPIMEKGYAKIRRIWQNGDNVKLSLNLPTRRVRADHRVKADAGKIALQRGPIIYCLEEIDNGPILSDIVLPKETPLTSYYDKNLLGGVVVVGAEALRVGTGRTKGIYRSYSGAYSRATLRAVPYCTWCNRTPGEMIVWTRER
jgi:DUF1680 family protein